MNQHPRVLGWSSLPCSDTSARPHYVSAWASLRGAEPLPGWNTHGNPHNFLKNLMFIDSMDVESGQRKESIACCLVEQRISRPAGSWGYMELPHLDVCLENYRGGK